MDDKKIFQRGVVAEKKKNLLSIKEPNNGEKVKQLASHDTKFLEDGYSKHGVESNYNVHLLHHLIKLDVCNNLETINHHLIKLDVCNNLETINHHLTPTPNYHIELMRQQMNKKKVMKLQIQSFFHQPFKTSPIAISQMLLEGLAKPKNLVNTKSMNNGPWDMTHNNMGIVGWSRWLHLQNQKGFKNVQKPYMKEH